VAELAPPRRGEVDCTMFVYIIKSPRANKHYVGSTTNLRKRLMDHNSGNGGKFTSLHRPWELVCYKSCANEQEARLVEKKIKAYKGGRAFRQIVENMEGWQSGRLHLS
jgi:putative endonuclease